MRHVAYYDFAYATRAAYVPYERRERRPSSNVTASPEFLTIYDILQAAETYFSRYSFHIGVFALRYFRYFAWPMIANTAYSLTKVPAAQ